MPQHKRYLYQFSYFFIILFSNANIVMWSVNGNSNRKIVKKIEYVGVYLVESEKYD